MVTAGVGVPRNFPRNGQKSQVTCILLLTARDEGPRESLHQTHIMSDIERPKAGVRIGDRAADERRDVAKEVAGRLRRRGVRLTGNETDEQLVRLLEAVERFEATVERHGGDLMVDEPVEGVRPIQPDDRRFVLPRRHDQEAVESFVNRIAEATERAAAR